jgi:secretion/DNA translocation related TadE-like protein
MNGGRGSPCRWRRAASRAVTDERGSGAIWVLAMGLVIALAAAAGGSWGLAATARHRAESAADLAALAAAAHSLDGQGRVCSMATAIVRANGSEVVRCQLTGDVAEVEVSRPLRIGSLQGWGAVARARAGPADALVVAPRPYWSRRRVRPGSAGSRRRLAALSSSPVAPLPAASSALRCIHLASGEMQNEVRAAPLDLGVRDHTDRLAPRRLPRR